MRNLNLHDVVLIGLSMGGRTVLEYGLEHGERLKPMIVLGPVGGEEHIVSPPAMSDILLREISDAQRVVFAGAPHPCYLDQPDNRHAALETFLQSIETC